MEVPFLSDNSGEIPRNSGVQLSLGLVEQTEAVQYQTSRSRNEDRRKMLGIALGLGLAYLGFLACWIWATRLRSRPRRH